LRGEQTEGKRRREGGSKLGFSGDGENEEEIGSGWEEAGRAARRITLISCCAHEKDKMEAGAWLTLSDCIAAVTSFSSSSE
jgi:hypothetical protein